MAKRGSNSAGTNSFGGWSFINISLGEAEKDELGELHQRGVFALELVFDLVQEGYKVSFSEDSKNHSYICSLSDCREDSPSFKHTLTGRGATPAAAFSACCYKHFNIARKDWTQYKLAEGRQGSMFG